jgi:hypothetical protein
MQNHERSAYRRPQLILVFSSVVTATILLIACQQQAPVFTEVERAAVEAEITAARDAYFDAATRFDADALVAFWDQGFVHFSNADFVPLTREMLAEAWVPLSHIEMDVTSARVVALSRDAGYTITTALGAVYDNSGAVVEQSRWAGTHIWVRTDEGWKVQAVHEGRPIQQSESTTE